jgi:hypothetical protein
MRNIAKASLAVFSLFEGGFYLKLEGLVVSVDLSRFLSSLPCRFGCDILILGHQQVEITENCKGFEASPKRKFL